MALLGADSEEVCHRAGITWYLVATPPGLLVDIYLACLAFRCESFVYFLS